MFHIKHKHKEAIGHCFLSTDQKINFSIIKNTGAANFGNRMRLNDDLGYIYVEDDDVQESVSAIYNFTQKLEEYGAKIYHLNEGIYEFMITNDVKQKWFGAAYKQFTHDTDILTNLNPHTFFGIQDQYKYQYDINAIVRDITQIYNFTNKDCVYQTETNTTFTIDNYIRQASITQPHYIAPLALAIYRRYVES